jgi:hypothetical protein
LDHDDVEVVTEHYRGAHAASVARSGFSCYRGSSGRIGGRSGAAGTASARSTGIDSMDRALAPHLRLEMALPPESV